MSQRYRDVLDYEIGARIVVEFKTDRRMVVDYAVILTVDDEEGEATVRTTPTTCTGTIAVVRRHLQRRSMPVLLEKGCGPRSPRFAPIIRR